MDAPYNKAEEKDNNFFSPILFRFAPYWLLFIILLFISGVCAWVYLSYVTPIYSASASIMIKDEKKGADDSKMVEALDVYAPKKIVENEVEVIQSRGLMKKVVDKLHLYAPVYERGRLKDINAYISSPVIVEAKEPDQLKNKERIFFSYDKSNSTVNIGENIYPINTWVNTPYGVLKFSKNPKAQLTPAYPLYFSLIQPKAIAGILIKNLTIVPVSKLSTVLELSYKDESPNRAQDVLNELINAYTTRTIDEKNALAANTLSSIETRLKNVVRDLDSIENIIKNYKSKEGIVDLSEQGRVVLQSISENDRKVADISGQLAVLDQAERYVISKDNREGIVPATVGIQDQLLVQLLQRLYQSELDYEKLKKTKAENDPAVTAVANEIERMRPGILESIRNQRASLEASRGSLNATSGNYTSMLKTMPEKERQLIEISRQQLIKNSVYSFLLQKREETVLSTSSIPESRVIDFAESSFLPVSPKKPLVYLIAFILAIGIAIAIITARELLTGKILFRSDIESYTKIPIAAEIASVKHKNELVIDQPGVPFIAEQFRHLRASLGLYSKNHLKKKLLITSSIAGEGKSFVAVNLALSLANSGKKVVIIDADLRSPKTSLIFGLKSEEGMTEYLKGQIDIIQVIRNSNRNNLYVIPAGGPCTNPTELLLNGKLVELFTYLDQLFDYVLIDTSPINPVTDAYVLSEYCDRTLFVVRHGYTPKTMIKMLDESDKIKVLHNLAIVFNGVRKRGFIKGGYGFGYGYGYEYVYADRNDTGNKKVNSTLN